MTNIDLLEEVKDTFQYPPETGELFWNPDRNKKWFKTANAYQAYLNHRAGKPVKTSINAHGYLVVGLKNKTLLVHRIAFVLMLGRFPKETLDHIDGNPLNNCWVNLREVPQCINARNQRKNSRNSSGFPGVYWVARDKKWASQVCINRTQKLLGSFDSPEEAHQTRVEYLKANPLLGYTQNHGLR